MSISYDPENHVLHIGNIEITDREVIREAARWTTGQRGEAVESRSHLSTADLGPFVRESVTVGARVLAIAAQSGETDAVQRAVRDASESMASAAKRASDNAEDAARRASDTMKTATREVHESIIRIIGGENPELLDRLRPVLDRVGGDLETKVAAALEQAHVSMAEESKRQHAEVTALIHEVRKEVAVKVAEQVAVSEVRSSTTLKGFDFEDQLAPILHEVAAQIGDRYQETADRVGILPNCKKGDGVFHVSAGNCRILVEAHDGATKHWVEYLDEAERNRKASCSLGIVRRVEDNGGRLLRVLSPKRVILAFDPENDTHELLHTTVLLMRTVAVAAATKFDDADLPGVEDKIREALAAIESLDEARKSARAINGHVEKIEKGIERASKKIRENLGAAAESLSGTGEAQLSVVEEDVS